MICLWWFDFDTLKSLDKAMLYASIYSGAKPVQQRIDEEGCGAIFGALQNA